MPLYERDELGRDYVTVDSSGYSYRALERGNLVKDFATSNLDELLELVFCDVVAFVVGDFERANRIEGQDSRRLCFAKRIELLARLSPEWAKRERERLERILSTHPFDDAAHARALLTAELRGQGTSNEAAWSKACERYPLPAPWVETLREDALKLDRDFHA